MSTRRAAALILVAFTGGAAAVAYGVWLWVDHGLDRVRW